MSKTMKEKMVKMKKKYDFSGYATRANRKCTDGRTIMRDAFKHQDGSVVPLVWQHLHDDPENVLGHAMLENREDGVYAYASFNSNPKAQYAKELVEHGDIKALSIFANQLKQNGGDVVHGSIREVSLVFAGANPGAFIESLTIEHSDGSLSESEDEAFIYSGDDIELVDDIRHEDETDGDAANANDADTADKTDEAKPEEKVVHEDKDPETEPATEAKEETSENTSDTVEHTDKEEKFDYEKVWESFTDDQKTLVYVLADMLSKNKTLKQSNDEGDNFDMKENIFEKNGEVENKATTLSHDQLSEIFADAKKCGSLKESVLAHAAEYGIDNIEYLFPDAKLVMDQPALIARRTEWVDGFLNAVRKVPFAKIKSMAADITADQARARGYVKGSLKKDEVIALLKRETNPTTIYKKQKLDNDDLEDITDFDVVAFLMSEMTLMLNEEIARAALVGDGRDPETEAADKIDETKIRPIYTDNDMYAHHVFVDNAMDVDGFIDEVILQRKNYKRAGQPTMYTTQDMLSAMLLLKDQVGRRIYNSKAELATTMGLKDIVPVEVMEGVTRTVTDVGDTALMAIIVNPADYTMGAKNGGRINNFKDFDIDYNQHKYLKETRMSGALVYPKSALVFERVTNPEV